MNSRERAKYRIIALPRFEKDLRKLDKEAKRRVLQGLSMLESQPFSFKALHGRFKGKYALRVGDYRIIYVIDEMNKIIHLMTVTHRRHAYK